MWNKIKLLSPIAFSVFVLFGFRWAAHRTALGNVFFIALPAWGALAAATVYRSSTSSVRLFGKTHTITRACAGAAALIALSIAGLLSSEPRALAPVWGLIAICMVCYFASGTFLIAGLAGRTNSRGVHFPPKDYLDYWLPLGFGRVLRRDLRIIGYAVFPGQKPRSDENNGRWVFSNALVARPMLFALLAMAIVELGVGHILLRNLDRGIVLAHMGLGGIFVVYIVGLLRAFSRLPTIIDDGLLQIRMSVLFEADVAIDSVVSVHRVTSMPLDSGGSIANGAILVAPNILVRANRAFSVTRMFKSAQKLTAVAFYVDAPDDLLKQLALTMAYEANSRDRADGRLLGAAS